MSKSASALSSDASSYICFNYNAPRVQERGCGQYIYAFKLVVEALTTTKGVTIFERTGHASPSFMQVFISLFKQAHIAPLGSSEVRGLRHNNALDIAL